MDVSAWVLIIELLIGLIAIPFAIFIIKKLTEAEVTTDTIIVNEDGNRADGLVIGNLISKKIGKNGRLILKYKAKDSKKQEVVTVIAEPNKVLAYPKGVWSKNKSVIRILPDSAQDYMSNLLKQLEEKSAETHIINAQRVGINRQQMHLQDMGEGEISATNLGLTKGFVKDTLKTQAKEEVKSSKSYQTSRDFQA